ncbi:MAG: tRNA (N(6)-L-threonylcarbamoyladenosine(37)-C(2))-methylthiotransferase MtaB [Gammaproteobacteria bacterium]|nr:tRNA (N(6)-L-threonylcarbamoyladenosine(37)-C(2))-methylthiotransferase MtaB [Gammaproteobacteria bacterium]
MKRVAFCTFGCRLNQYDTETIRTLLEDEGEFRTVPFKDEADVYVVNTCSVTARADASARKMIRRIHSERPDSRIVVTGCYAQRAPEELAQLPGVSLIVGAADRGQIAAQIQASRIGAVRMAVSPIEQANKFLEVPVTEMMERSRAFVKVQEGCNEQCSFCIVPQTRGVSRSRDPALVLEQVAQLLKAGYPEIVLTGVHVGDYGLDLTGRRELTALIVAILEQPGLARLRLSSIEPSTITDELIEVMAGESKFARHFHIPFQSGNNAVLKKMRRRYTVEAFDRLVERIGRKLDEFALGTDVICGFPGEDDAAFQDTFDCLSRWPITYIHPFTYSVRPGSEAERLGDPISGEVKKRRTRALKRLSKERSDAFHEQYVERTVEVLTEVSERRGETVVSGLTDTYVRVYIDNCGENARELTGLRRVRVTAKAADGVVGALLPA